MESLLGQRFGRWVVIDHGDGRFPVCRCDCGSIGTPYRVQLLSGKSKSCGCSRRTSIIGMRVGRLVVVSESDWIKPTCICDCGREKDVRRSSLLSGETKSCGCLSSEASSIRLTTHGNARCGMHTPEYRTWARIKRRCFNPNHDKYSYYGGRGITVCERWRNDFNAFLEDMGTRPSKSHSIDRVDSNGDYEPGNCRWATPKEQASNRRPRGPSKNKTARSAAPTPTE